MDNFVDNEKHNFPCGQCIFRPQFPVYDISRAASEVFGVFPSFPSLYYEYYFLSFLLRAFSLILRKRAVYRMHGVQSRLCKSVLSHSPLSCPLINMHISHKPTSRFISSFERSTYEIFL